jgi:hypothetical protein
MLMHLQKVMFFVLSLSLFMPNNVHSAPEYGVKAAILYNLVRMVEWPSDSIASATAPVTICIIGIDPFEQALDMIREKKVRQRPLSFSKNIDLAQVHTCAVLFIADSETARLNEIINAVQHLPLLTVSDSEGWGERGVVANLIRDTTKIRIELNLKAAQRAQLEISSTLRDLAKEVEDSFVPMH